MIAVEIAEFDVKVFLVVLAVKVGHDIANVHDPFEHGFVLTVNSVDSGFGERSLGLREYVRCLDDELTPMLADGQSGMIGGLFCLSLLV